MLTNIWRGKNVWIHIFWAGDRVRSNNSGQILLKNQHGREMTAKHVIITVPLTVLKDGDITFTPALPADKNEAIRTIQMLGAWKIKSLVVSNAASGRRSYIKFTAFVGSLVRYGLAHMIFPTVTKNVTWLSGLKLLSPRKRNGISADRKC
ncbi:unnamed protein product [Pocillopora meandrina]|uniref:Amine oxidase domain-containing protein n=1 Tax=Pocillopora meandrina TaxID=46732 RepID=A0AAU9W4X0_9CNID|nr:unnamed protein product [Pocillopora meandrina]